MGRSDNATEPHLHVGQRLLDGLQPAAARAETRRFLAVKRPVHPYKRALQNRSTMRKRDGRFNAPGGPGQQRGVRVRPLLDPAALVEVLDRHGDLAWPRAVESFRRRLAYFMWIITSEMYEAASE